MRRELETALWTERQIQMAQRHMKPAGRVKIRRQIKGREAWSFTWRLMVGMVVVPIGIIVTCTLVGAPLGLYIIWLGCRPLNRLFEIQLQQRRAAEEAVTNPEKFNKEVHGWLVRLHHTA